MKANNRRHEHTNKNYQFTLEDAMFEHLSNCHGERNALLALLGSMPFAGTWLRTRFIKEKSNELD